MRETPTSMILRREVEDFLGGIESTCIYLTSEVRQTARRGFNDALAQRPINYWQFRSPEIPEEEIKYSQNVYRVGYDIGRSKLEREAMFPLQKVRYVKPAA